MGRLIGYEPKRAKVEIINGATYKISPQQVTWDTYTIQPVIDWVNVRFLEEGYDYLWGRHSYEPALFWIMFKDGTDEKFLAEFILTWV